MLLNFNFYLSFVAQVYPVALPDGTTFLPPDHLPFFANYSITFWFPDTIGSFDACKSFAKKISEEKCRTKTGDNTTTICITYESSERCCFLHPSEFSW